MQYIATFHTHYAALCFHKKLAQAGVNGRMMPVPRSLSASCGSCVAFETDADFMPLLVEDTQGIYAQEGNDYIERYHD